MYSRTDDERTRKQITLIEKAFRQRPTPQVKRRIDALRRENVTGENLLRELITIHEDYKLGEREQARQEERRHEDIPRIICSEALIRFDEEGS